MALPAAYGVGDGENGPAVSEYRHQDSGMKNQLQISEQLVSFLHHLFNRQDDIAERIRNLKYFLQDLLGNVIIHFYRSGRIGMA